MNRHNALKAERGITLIEVMVAFVILALSVTVLLRIFSSGLSNTVISQQYVDAVVLAETRMAQIGTTMEIIPGVESGEAGEKYIWKTVIDPYYPWQGSEDGKVPVSAFVVDVEVSWEEKGRMRNVVLTSIKLQQNSITSGRG